MYDASQGCMKYPFPKHCSNVIFHFSQGSMEEGLIKSSVMRVILSLVILFQITMGQQPHPFPKGYGHTPSKLYNFY